MEPTDHPNGLGRIVDDLAATDGELSDLVTAMIEHREALRDRRKHILAMRAKALTADLRRTLDRMQLEDLACFKDVLALHRRKP